MINLVSITRILMSESDLEERLTKTRIPCINMYIFIPCHLYKQAEAMEKKKDNSSGRCGQRPAQLILYVYKNNVSIWRKPFLRRFDVL